jgi:predicted DNA binding CopG/RHH family protein
MKKKFPVLKTDEEAEAFLEQDYLHAGNFKSAHWMRFEFKPKRKSLNLRISVELLDAVRKNVKREVVYSPSAGARGSGAQALSGTL